ncbi:MAG: DEAD/DEAH box helicase [Treponema sp.]|nr:DEAD/DEAH box helicase [Treponema sp.]
MDSQIISFKDLGLDEKTLVAVARKGFEIPSPIQVLAIPRLLNGNANVIARARTGTGKTAAFGLPLVQSLREGSEHVRALVLEPTRELAVQTCEELQAFTEGKFPRTCVVYGGASIGQQLRELKRGSEIVVGTPGRVMDLINRGALDIHQIDYFILDEGDEMLDMGFIEDIESIFEEANPKSRILLFSATMPAPILKIASSFMGNYEIVEEEDVVDEPLLIEQRYWLVRESDKIEALVRLIDSTDDFYGLVFTQTKMDADNVCKQLDERGYEAAVLHGDIMQSQREKVLARFRRKKTRVLVATDVAARGIDIAGLSNVVNYSMPQDAWTYVHRIGRTGRAGAVGKAVTFVRPEESRRKLASLQAAIKKRTKNELQEEAIPSVEEVLEKKRGRLFEQLKADIGLAAAEDGSRSLVAVGTQFSVMASELCKDNDAESVLAAVMSVLYGKSLDKSHYGEIKVQKTETKRKSARKGARDGASDEDQLRLYVQLGRRDGYGPREIADYFSDLLNIPERVVDRIDIAQNFTLVSLPVASAKRALEMAKGDSDIPHMHIDAKDVARGRKDDFDVRHGRRTRAEKKDSHAERRPLSRSRARANVHTPTERNSHAGLYKRKSSAERF